MNVPVSVETSPSDQTVCPGDTATFNVTATGTDLGYQWWEGTNVLAGQTNSSLELDNVTADEAGIYSVVASGAAGDPLTNSATLTVNVPVTVSVPPADQTAVVGDNVTVSVTATGTGLSYQWLFNDSVVGTDSSLTLNNVTTSQAGLYTVIVSGACGSTTNSATLTVNALQPPNLTIVLTNSVRVAWPAVPAGFVLQTNTDLTTTNWGDYTGPVDSVGSINSVTFEKPLPRLFFRLKH